MRVCVCVRACMHDGEWGGRIVLRSLAVTTVDTCTDIIA